MTWILVVVLGVLTATPQTYVLRRNLPSKQVCIQESLKALQRAAHNHVDLAVRCDGPFIPI